MMYGSELDVEPEPGIRPSSRSAQRKPLRASALISTKSSAAAAAAAAANRTSRVLLATDSSSLSTSLSTLSSASQLSRSYNIKSGEYNWRTGRNTPLSSSSSSSLSYTASYSSKSTRSSPKRLQKQRHYQSYTERYTEYNVDDEDDGLQSYLLHRIAQPVRSSSSPTTPSRSKSTLPIHTRSPAAAAATAAAAMTASKVVIQPVVPDTPKYRRREGPLFQSSSNPASPFTSTSFSQAEDIADVRDEDEDEDDNHHNWGVMVESLDVHPIQRAIIGPERWHALTTITTVARPSSVLASGSQAENGAASSRSSRADMDAVDANINGKNVTFTLDIGIGIGGDTERGTEVEAKCAVCSASLTSTTSTSSTLSVGIEASSLASQRTAVSLLSSSLPPPPRTSSSSDSLPQSRLDEQSSSSSPPTSVSCEFCASRTSSSSSSSPSPPSRSLLSRRGTRPLSSSSSSSVRFTQSQSQSLSLSLVSGSAPTTLPSHPVELALSPLVEHILESYAEEKKIADEAEENAWREALLANERRVANARVVDKGKGSRDGSGGGAGWLFWRSKSKSSSNSRASSPSPLTRLNTRTSRPPSPSTPLLTRTLSYPSTLEAQPGGLGPGRTNHKVTTKTKNTKPKNPITIAYGYRASSSDVQHVFSPSSSSDSILSPSSSPALAAANGGNPSRLSWEARRTIEDELDGIASGGKDAPGLMGKWNYVALFASAVSAPPSFSGSPSDYLASPSPVDDQEHEEDEDDIEREEEEIEDVEVEYEIEMETFTITPPELPADYDYFAPHPPHSTSYYSNSDSNLLPSPISPSPSSTQTTRREFSSQARKTKRALRDEGRSASPLPRASGYLGAAARTLSQSSRSQSQYSRMSSQSQTISSQYQQPIVPNLSLRTRSSPPLSNPQSSTTSSPSVLPPRKKTYILDTRFFLVFALENSVRRRVLRRGEEEGVGGPSLEKALGWEGSRAVTMVRKERLPFGGSPTAAAVSSGHGVHGSRRTGSVLGEYSFVLTSSSS